MIRIFHVNAPRFKAEQRTGNARTDAGEGAGPGAGAGAGASASAGASRIASPTATPPQTQSRLAAHAGRRINCIRQA
ncbi:hypothetical protein YH64_012875 [Achromobacter sp. LC458]|nr:hypothetical protein YH64_012875 [Achromobacter sp. LC458]